MNHALMAGLASMVLARSRRDAPPHPRRPVRRPGRGKRRDGKRKYIRRASGYRRKR